MTVHDTGLRSLSSPFTKELSVNPILSAQSADKVIQVLPPIAMVALGTVSSPGNGHQEVTSATLARIHTKRPRHAGLSVRKTVPISD